ncbi:MAG: HAD family hydrolase [Desulfovibrionales bacterium]
MRPLAEMPESVRARINWVLTDIDDTLTDQGRLGATAYTAMERLQQAGIIVVPVTGRPAGWCDHISRMWPVDGVIGENGAFFFRYLEAERKMLRVYARDPQQRKIDRERLDLLGLKICNQIQGAAISADQAFREADLAVDFCEDVSPLPRCDVERIKRMFEEEGACAKISSIHVNGWFGAYDKLSMTRCFFSEALGIDLDSVTERIVFAGDSPNDAPMFAYFPNSVGVANVLDFTDRLDAHPAWVCSLRGGQGFAELAEALLAAR